MFQIITTLQNLALYLPMIIRIIIPITLYAYILNEAIRTIIQFSNRHGLDIRLFDVFNCCIIIFTILGIVFEIFIPELQLQVGFASSHIILRVGIPVINVIYSLIDLLKTVDTWMRNRLIISHLSFATYIIVLFVYNTMVFEFLNPGII